jgi:hypothetical protein
MILLLSGCGNFRPLQSKNVETTIDMRSGTTLHIDTDVDCGTIYVKVTDQSGTIYFDEVLQGNYCCKINNFSHNRYTVPEIWTEAKGEVNVYPTKIGRLALRRYNFLTKISLPGQNANALCAERKP